MPFPILFGTTVTTVLHYRADCDEARVMKRLDKLREDKAVDADESVPRFFSKIKQELARPLSVLFSNITINGQVPADWKDSNVIIIIIIIFAFVSCHNVVTSEAAPVTV